MNNTLGFLLAYKSAEGLPKNRRLLYGILGAQAPAGDISQAAIPMLLAKREVNNQPQPIPTPTRPPEVDFLPNSSNSTQAITEEQLDIVREHIPLDQLRQLKQELEEYEEERKAREEEKKQYECLFSCLHKIKPNSDKTDKNTESLQLELKNITPQSNTQT